jgi:hypothetical protein
MLNSFKSETHPTRPSVQIRWAVENEAVKLMV